MSVLKTAMCLLVGIALTACSSVEMNFADSSQPLGSGPILVTVPASLKVLSVDGEQVSAPDLHRGFYELRLKPGQHRVLTQYFENWNEPDEAGYLIKWSPVELSYDFQRDATYQLQYEQPASREHAQRMAAKPSVWISRAGNEKVVEGTVVAVEPKPSVLTQVLNPPPSVVATTSPTLEQLKELWQQASDEDRKSFWQWIGP